MALIAIPALVVRWLLGAEPAGVALPLARVAGIALLSLAVASWPSARSRGLAPWGLAAYNLLVAIYLLNVGVRGVWAGPLLWPAAVLHSVLSVPLGLACLPACRVR
ncbi:MAG: hypothetical protein ACT4QC_19860 [Planctomycetaceae bacterium]